MKININKWLVLLIVISITGCASKSSDGTYVARWKNEFSIAEDTIVIKGKVVTKRTGYQKIRNGEIREKQWKVQKWLLNDPNSPIIEKGHNEIVIGSVTYILIGR